MEELLKPLAQPGGVLEAKDVKESVSQLTDSVVRNPDAMLLVTRLREKSAAAHARALQVSIYMIVFARVLELAREELELLGMVGLLQDVGKTRLPAGLMEKSGGAQGRYHERQNGNAEHAYHRHAAFRQADENGREGGADEEQRIGEVHARSLIAFTGRGG